MREEIIATLAKFFKENGLMNSAEYSKNNSVPYTLRDIERTFNDYAEVLYLVSQKLAELEKVEPAPAAPVTNKKSVKRQFKRAKEDSLDE